MKRIVALTSAVLLAVTLAVLVLGPKRIWYGGQARLERWKLILAGKLVDAGGHRLRVDRLGKGRPAVVMEAGLAQFRARWGRIPADIATFTEVLIYDRAGLNDSDYGPLPRTSKQIVTELHTMLKNSGIQPPYVLVGHSFGGMNVRLFASQYPDQVAAIVLLDASHEDEYLRLAAAMPEDQRKEYLEHESGGNYESVDLLASAEEIRAAAPLKPVPYFVVSAPGDQKSMGKNGAQIHDDLQSALTRLLPNCTQIVAENSGHFIHLDRPELVTDAVRKAVEMARQAQTSGKPMCPDWKSNENRC